MTISRRNVVRGVAWATPVALVSVSVPAFAASYAPPTINGQSQGGKCPGQSTNFNWGFIIPVDTTGPVDNLNITTVTYNGTTVTDFCVSRVSPTRFAITFDSNSSANGSGNGVFSYTLTYTAPDGTTQTASGVAGFSYDGTHPVDKPTCNAVNCG